MGSLRPGAGVQWTDEDLRDPRQKDCRAVEAKHVKSIWTHNRYEYVSNMYRICICIYTLSKI